MEVSKMPGKQGAKWICPICGRHFSRKNQPHSCELYSIKKHHFKNVAPELFRIYEKILSHFQDWGSLSVEPLKNIIALKKTSQFCTFQIQKTAIKIIFRSFSLLESPRLTLMPQSQQADQYYYYRFKIQTLDEVNEELIKWFHQAYLEN